MISFLNFLIEGKFKKGTIVGQFYGDERGFAPVDALIRGTQTRNQTRRVKDLVRVNQDVSTKEGRLGDQLRNPSEPFMSRTNKADMGFPIHVDSSGNIVDGSHRLAKAHFAGQKKIQTKLVSPTLITKHLEPHKWL
jgi:hypothetical protein